LLRAAVRLSVQSWGACYESVLVRLSGGLDSSIVLGCLADSSRRPHIIAHVNYLPTRAGDERAFAQKVVQHAGCEMAVHEKVLSDLRLEDILGVPLTVCPAPDLSHLEVSRIDRPIIRQRGARAVFNGEGGDSLFASRIDENAVVDFICRRGIRPGLFDLALLMAPLAQMSVWRVLGVATRRSLQHRKDPPDEIPSLRCLASLEAIEHATSHVIQTLHPWFHSRPDIPPGKAVHIRSVLHADIPFHDLLAQPEDPDDIQPLRCQPAIEAALRIPTYTHVHDGRDRGLARQAFTREVPPEVLNRLWKGRPQNFASKQLWRDIRFVRELLLDGLLVQHRLLDRAKVEQALSGPTSMGDSVLEIFDHIITEAWARRWADTV
jgi:asparagine synthase (glutamine-hydrolysing)